MNTMEWKKNSSAAAVVVCFFFFMIQTEPIAPPPVSLKFYCSDEYSSGLDFIAPTPYECISRIIEKVGRMEQHKKKQE